MKEIKKIQNKTSGIKPFKSVLKHFNNFLEDTEPFPHLTHAVQNDANKGYILTLRGKLRSRLEWGWGEG